MENDAARLTLGDVVTLQRGTTYKSALLGKPGPVLLGLASIQRNGGFRDDNLKTYGGDSPDKLTLHAGDIYVSLKDVTQSADLLGAVARVPPHIAAGRVTQDTVKLTFLRKDIPSRYIYWLLRTPVYREYCRGHAIGTTNLSIARDDFLAFPVPKPTARELTLVETLDLLDDQIELNRRMNGTLEEMARALFETWFLDFNPVRAKLDGHAPAAVDPDTAALFPDQLEDSPLGHIPKGWTMQRLPDAIEVNPRRTLKRGTIAPYLDMKNLPTQGHCAEEVIDREFNSGTKFQNGDTLLARITPCLENGKTGYVDFLEDGQVGWGSTEYIILSPKPPLPPQFGYLLARSDALRTHAIQNMTGTSGRQRVPPECFNTFWLAVPPRDIAHRFDELTAPLMAKIKANSVESRTLATLRDTLLPKLLSGALSVQDSTT